MPRDIQALRLDGFASLPPHARSCVFWELDCSTGDAVHDAAFEKEAWASTVLLEWGKCAQVAIEGPDDDDMYDPDAFPLCGTAVAVAFYAPPSRIPGAARFPTGPVSADAILLTSIIGAESRIPQQESKLAPDVVAELISAVVTDLVRRGVRAVEAFGREADPDDTDSSLAAVTAASPSDAAGTHDDGMCRQCIIDAAALRDAGFDEVSPHPRYPRFRLELDEGLGWKAEVESALERLFVVAALDVTTSQHLTKVSTSV